MAGEILLANAFISACGVYVRQGQTIKSRWPPPMDNSDMFDKNEDLGLSNPFPQMFSTLS